MQKEKLITKIQSAEYLDADSKKKLITQTNNLSELKIIELITFFDQVKIMGKKMKKEKNNILTKIYHIFRGMNNYSKKRARKEKLEKNENTSQRKDEQEKEKILSQIGNI